MGLAASQARYLELTARRSNLEYEAQQINQQKLELAKQTELIATEYSNAKNNKILMFNTVSASTGQAYQTALTYDIIVDQNPFSGLCMRLVDASGNVVVPENIENITGLTITTNSAVVSDSENEINDSTSRTYNDIYSFMNKCMPGLTQEEIEENNLTNFANIYNYFMANQERFNRDGNISIEKQTSNYSSLVKDGEHYVIDYQIKESDYLNVMLKNGQYYLQKADSSQDSGWSTVEWQGSEYISDVFDKSDDAAAEAEYEKQSASLQKKDKALDLRLEQINSEHDAVQTEMDSVKSVLEKNVESTFKTFG